MLAMTIDGRDLTPEILAWQRARDPKPCQWCGGQMVQPARGRRRVYCSSRCRRDAYSARFGRELQAWEQKAIDAGWTPPE